MRFKGDSRSGEPLIAYSAPSSVRLYSSSPRFSRIASVDLPPEGGPSSSSNRRPTSEPGRRRLEVVDHATERLIDAEQLALEELARLLGIARLRSRGRATAACPRYIRGWCECSPPGAAAECPVRKSLSVPSQRCARCSLLNLKSANPENPENWTLLLAVILPSSNLRCGIWTGPLADISTCSIEVKNKSCESNVIAFNSIRNVLC